MDAERGWFVSEKNPAGQGRELSRADKTAGKHLMTGGINEMRP
jgi:hypothetical protein